MAVKYHVNSNGDVKPCNATKNKCRYGESDTHFDTKEAGRAYYEANVKDYLVKPSIKKTPKIVDAEEMERRLSKGADALKREIEVSSFEATARALKKDAEEMLAEQRERRANLEIVQNISKLSQASKDQKSRELLQKNIDVLNRKVDENSFIDNMNFARENYFSPTPKHLRNLDIEENYKELHSMFRGRRNRALDELKVNLYNTNIGKVNLPYENFKETAVVRRDLLGALKEKNAKEAARNLSKLMEEGHNLQRRAFYFDNFRRLLRYRKVSPELNKSIITEIPESVKDEQDLESFTRAAYRNAKFGTQMPSKWSSDKDSKDVVAKIDTFNKRIGVGNGQVDNSGNSQSTSRSAEKETFKKYPVYDQNKDITAPEVRRGSTEIFKRMLVEKAPVDVEYLEKVFEGSSDVINDWDNVSASDKYEFTNAVMSSIPETLNDYYSVPEHQRSKKIDGVSISDLTKKNLGKSLKIIDGINNRAISLRLQRLSVQDKFLTQKLVSEGFQLPEDPSLSL